MRIAAGVSPSRCRLRVPLSPGARASPTGPLRSSRSREPVTHTEPEWVEGLEESSRAGWRFYVVGSPVSTRSMIR